MARRITEVEGLVTTDLFCSSDWQVVEARTGTRLGSGGTVTDQYVWSPFYADDLVERDADPQVTGSAASNGGPDAGFGTAGDGTVRTSSQTLGGGRVTSAAAAADGDDLVVASVVGGSPVLAFYAGDGTLDPAYGSGSGLVSPADGLLADGPWTAITGIVVNPGGTIDLAVTTADGAGTLQVAQLSPDGSADDSFGQGGLQTIGSLPAAAGIALSAGGADLLVAGAAGSTLTVAALSLADGGQLDPTFGYNQGFAATDVGGGTFTSAGVAVEPDGEVVTGGVDADGNVVMALLLPNGIPDDRVDAADQANYRAEPMPSGSTLTTATIATDGQGRILVTAGGAGRLLVARYEPDLRPDTSFGNQSGQWAGTEAIGVNGTFEAAATVQATGSIVIGGYGSGGSVLVRLLPDGTLDGSFGSSGVVNPPAGSGAGLAVAAGPDGRAVAVSLAGDGGLQLERFDTQAASQRLYAEHDADYNTTSLTDAAGNVVERYVYDPYGNVTVLNADWTIRGEGLAADSQYGWAVLHQGLFLDAVTGNYYDRNREYGQGRFLQQDPAGYIAGPNRYQLQLSNPVQYVDPSGLEPAGRGHMYPIYLGGSNAQPVIYLSDPQHTAMHDYLRDIGLGSGRGGKTAASQKVWKALSAKDRKAIIAQGMRKAGVSESMIQKEIKNIMAGETPGVQQTRKYGRLITAEEVSASVAADSGNAKLSAARAQAESEMDAVTGKISKLLMVVAALQFINAGIDIAKAADDGRADPEKVCKVIHRYIADGRQETSEEFVKVAMMEYINQIMRDSPDAVRAGADLAIQYTDLSDPNTLTDNTVNDGDDDDGEW